MPTTMPMSLVSKLNTINCIYSLHACFPRRCYTHPGVNTLESVEEH